MHFPLVSAWNKRRRSKSYDTDPCTFLFSIIFARWRKRVYRTAECWQIEDQTSQPRKRRYGSCVYTLKEMEEATNSFSDDNLLGKGGFGRVYKGTLKTGEVVAIKKMDLPPFKKADGEREFRVEVDILSRLDHPNLVSLIGYCADGKHRFLVYEYMQNGNLQDHLNGLKEAKISWPIRLRIALGAAKGLAYLHSSSGVGIPIVHRDFKSTNVLLDTYYNAKTGKLTLQSDIYAFGVVLLELLTGRRAVDLTQGPNEQNLVLQVKSILNDRKKLRKVIDPELSRNSYSMEAIAMFADLASRCIRIESSERPSVTDCVKELQLIIYTNSKGGLGGTIPTFRRL
ncbi:hypothetical protein IGI04_037041 [Brassica rapa subsp. trilocularis]|uniref:Protein kinase domain-containing protein n=1 Tax=Brassica rapa subsp. trilocularis TaxID=1813537 RepID=A0ABQ7LIF9_BRACM|nr:hypothetical protein IGI04_037041 [Brassica rapa subsp. trilocularis]